MLPQRAPSAEELLNDPVVQQALEQAWADSRVDDPALRHEEGGWIYLNVRTSYIDIRRAPAGEADELDIRTPPVVADSVLIGTFHTHPNPASEGWETGPSPNDERFHHQVGLPGLIRAEDGVHVTGPERRRGGFGGGPTFPL